MSLFKDKIELEIQEAELGTQKALSQFPPLLRWVFILLILAIIPAYFVAKSASQKIWLSRFAQGAIQAKPSFTNPLPPTVSNVSVTSLGPNQYDAIVQITNPNLDLSLDNVPYTFIFSNAQKQQVYSYSDNLYLLPNQIKYLTVPTFTADDKIVYTNFQLPPNLPWQKPLQIPTVSLTTSQPGTYEQSSPTALVVQGDFLNDSPYQLATVRLIFVLYDGSGNIIGVSQRDEFTVAPFERRSYKQLWPGLAAPNLAKTEVDAYTDTLDPSNLTVPAPTDNSASSLSRP